MPNTKLRKTQRGIWEANVRTLDLKNPRVLKWYMEKKIHAGEWQALGREDLRRMLPELKMDPAIGALLKRFFSSQLHHHRHVASHSHAKHITLRRRTK